VTDESSVNAAAKQVEAQFGRLDVLINNAGITDATLPDNYSLKQKLDTVLTTNVTGPAIVSKAFQPLLFKSKNAYSIYVSSGLGSMTLASDPTGNYYRSPWSIYRLSKTGLNMWAYQESKELAERGVKVFVVCPGLVRSNLRGKKEESVSAGGRATDPMVSGQTMLNIIEGKRDKDVGKFVHKDGVYGW
jgi:NAD(P)-dependent dehydrogenase (short-subunit alcohol dehydrogenase family)